MGRGDGIEAVLGRGAWKTRYQARAAGLRREIMGREGSFGDGPIESIVSSFLKAIARLRLASAHFVPSRLSKPHLAQPNGKSIEAIFSAQGPRRYDCDISTPCPDTFSGLVEDLHSIYFNEFC